MITQSIKDYVFSLKNIDECTSWFIVYKSGSDSFITNKKDLKIIYNKILNLMTII